MNAFLQIPKQRRLLAFQQVDAAMGLQAVSVEKDFWVCCPLRSSARRGWSGNGVRERFSIFEIPIGIPSPTRESMAEADFNDDLTNGIRIDLGEGPSRA